MPTYEYQCDACGVKFDQFQSIKAAPLKKCPHCNRMKLRRLISTGGGLIFKGSGFYITDYRSESYKTAAKNDSGGKTDSAKSDNVKSDSGASTATASSPAPAPVAASSPAPKAPAKSGK